MALPVAQALRTTTHTQPIDFLCSRSTAPLVELSPHVDHVYGLKQRNVPFALSREKQKLVVELAGRQYSRAVLMESAPRFLKILSATGLSEIRSYVEEPFDPLLHSVENNLRLAGLEPDSISPLEIDLSVSDSSCLESKERLQELPRPVIGIHPGYGPRARKSGQTARLRGWSRSSFVRVAQALQQRGASVVITGSEEDTTDAHLIAGPPQTGADPGAGGTDDPSSAGRTPLHSGSLPFGRFRPGPPLRRHENSSGGLVGSGQVD